MVLKFSNCSNKSLVTQTEDDYINCGLDVGVYFGDRKELGKTYNLYLAPKYFRQEKQVW